MQDIALLILNSLLHFFASVLVGVTRESGPNDRAAPSCVLVPHKELFVDCKLSIPCFPRQSLYFSVAGARYNAGLSYRTVGWITERICVMPFEYLTSTLEMLSGAAATPPLQKAAAWIWMSNHLDTCFSVLGKHAPPPNIVYACINFQGHLISECQIQRGPRTAVK